MLNNVSLVGRLTKDPIIKETQSGKVIASFTLAVQRTKDDVDFIPCEAWTRTAESIRDYVTKGSLIGVEGSIKVDNWDTEEGRRTYTKVVANRVHFIILRSSETEESGYSNEYNVKPRAELSPEDFMTDEEKAGL